MRSPLPRIAAAALLLLPAACGALGRAPQASFVREIVALNRELEEFFRAGDLLAVADVYAGDAVMIGRGEARWDGREEIDAYWSGIGEPVDWRLEVFEIGGSDELAYELGRSHLVRRRDGVERTSVVDFVLIWKRDVEGRWRIAVDAYW